MNLNPAAIKILCYGDSNTWGQIPLGLGRYPADVRWTGLLQQKLGEKFEVIEEGLSGRNTRFDYPEGEGKNGLEYLLPCLETQNPIDVVIVFLGTNNLKENLNQTPAQIADSIRQLILIMKDKAWNQQKTAPKILLISPAIVDETVLTTQLEYRGAKAKSAALAAEYMKIATAENCPLLDLALLVQPSKKDGLHFEPEAHQVVAEAIFQQLQLMMK